MSISKAYLVDICTPDQRPAVLGYFNAISSVGFIVGPLVSGYLADIDPTLHLSLFTGACVYALNILLAFFVLPPSPSDTSSPGGKDSTSSDEPKPLIDWDQVSNSINVFKGFHWQKLNDIIVVRFLTIIAVMIFRCNFAVFMEENFSISNTDLGRINSYSGVVAVFASATCGTISKRYPGFSKHPAPVLMLLSFSLIYAMLSNGISHILLCLFLLSLSTSYLRICLLNLMLERGREDERGAILGFTYSLSSICRMLSPSLVGVAQEAGSRTCVCLSAVCAVTALLAMLCLVRKKTAHVT